MGAPTSPPTPGPGSSAPRLAPDTRTGARRGRRSGLIDLIFNGLDSPWAVEILRGVEEWCAERATGVVVSAVRHGSARPASWTSALASHDTEGVILVTSELTAPQLKQLRGEGIPLVVVDPVNLPDADLPSVGTTNWAGGLAATDHLISSATSGSAPSPGRRIICATGPGWTDTARRWTGPGSRSGRNTYGTATFSTRAGSSAAGSC